MAWSRAASWDSRFPTVSSTLCGRKQTRRPLNNRMNYGIVTSEESSCPSGTSACLLRTPPSPLRPGGRGGRRAPGRHRIAAAGVGGQLQVLGEQGGSRAGLFDPPHDVFANAWRFLPVLLINSPLPVSSRLAEPARLILSFPTACFALKQRLRSPLTLCDTVLVASAPLTPAALADAPFTAAECV